MSSLFSMLLDYALHLDLIWRCKDTKYFSFCQTFPQLFSPFSKHLTFPPLAFNISVPKIFNNHPNQSLWLLICANLWNLWSIKNHLWSIIINTVAPFLLCNSAMTPLLLRFFPLQIYHKQQCHCPTAKAHRATTL